MNVLQKVIYSLPIKEDLSELNLLVEAGNQGISFFWYGKSPFEPEGIVIYSFKQKISEGKIISELGNLLKNDPVLRMKNKTVKVFYNVNESLLVPDSFFDESSAKDSLDMIFGDAPEDVVRTDEVAGKQMMNIYRVSKPLDDILSGIIRDFEPRHSNATLIENMLIPAQNTIYCTIHPNEFRVIVCFHGILQMVQQFEYKSPGDVIYFLLDICYQSSLNPSETTLVLDGMIETNSGLYTEFVKYFLNTEFSETSKKIILPENLSNYPMHYFNNLASLAICV